MMSTRKTDTGNSAPTSGLVCVAASESSVRTRGCRACALVKSACDAVCGRVHAVGRRELSVRVRTVGALSTRLAFDGLRRDVQWRHVTWRVPVVVTSHFYIIRRHVSRRIGRANRAYYCRVARAGAPAEARLVCNLSPSSSVLHFHSSGCWRRLQIDVIAHPAQKYSATERVCLAVIYFCGCKLHCRKLY